MTLTGMRWILMAKKDEVLYVQDDKLHIPESIMNMTLDEIDKAIQELEEQHMTDKNIA